MILVTGGTGLLGASLLHQLLLIDKQVRAIYRNEKNIQKTKDFFTSLEADYLFTKIEWVRADLTDIPSLELAFESITQVYHCAALISFDPADRKNLEKTNIEGTANMINLSLDMKIDKFCYVSSIAALGDTVLEDSLINEDSDWNPNIYHSNYAISKHGAEMEVWRGSQEGLKVVIVNPGILFGSPIFKDGSQTMITKLKKGFPFYTKGMVGVIDATDTAMSMISLMEHPAIQNKQYILVSENISYQTLLSSIANSIQKTPPRLYVGPLATSIAWRMDWLISSITSKKRSFTRSLSKAAHTPYIYENSRIKNELNIEFKGLTDLLNHAIK